MIAEKSLIETPRLRLRWWRDADRDAFAALNADPVVMADLGGPIGRAHSDRKYNRYLAALDEFGFSRWAVEDRSGTFLGYVGVMPRRGPHPLGDHDEIGWRLNRHAWGHGYAPEAAHAALGDAFSRAGLTEVIAMTSPDNERSQAVARRIGMHRDPSRDFFSQYRDGRVKEIVVLVATPP
ncbi:GNAT family N-acetyltransferase [Nitratireductor sp. XY-223]|uniref:GNAT family N-acetyltransferase n=1 Tax=Nitratireductor sp. XY-223 TaxID=2561926 RepID=UPI0010A996F5|nr:GNAT family N-acetyltransferase [Nitratireductor sp. XY-223]